MTSFKLTVKTESGVKCALTRGRIWKTKRTGRFRSIERIAVRDGGYADQCPRTTEVGNREWRLFINRVYSGISFVQPGKGKAMSSASLRAPSVESHLRSVTFYAERKVRERPRVVAPVVVIKGRRRAGADAREKRIEGGIRPFHYSVPKMRARSARSPSGWELAPSAEGAASRQEAEARDGRLLGDLERRLPDCRRRRSLYLCGNLFKERGMYFKWKSQSTAVKL